MKNSIRKLRLRRKSKAITKHGVAAGPKHRAKTGRTGKIRASRLRSGVSKKPSRYRRAYVFVPGRGMVLTSAALAAIGKEE